MRRKMIAIGLLLIVFAAASCDITSLLGMGDAAQDDPGTAVDDQEGKREGYFLHSGDPGAYSLLGAEEMRIEDGIVVAIGGGGEEIAELEIVDGYIAIGRRDRAKVEMEEGESITVSRDGTAPLIYRHGRR